MKYVLQRRHKNRLKQVADQHFRESALPKYVELIEQRLGGTLCVCLGVFRLLRRMWPSVGTRESWPRGVRDSGGMGWGYGVRVTTGGMG